MEGAALGIFMISVCVFGALLEHPMSPFRQMIDSADIRRTLAGAAMGLTAIGIFCSPWGQRSGAHMNPAVTLSFFSLGKMDLWDSFFYVIAQLGGGILGVGVAHLLVGLPLRHSSVSYAATMPRFGGVYNAFLGELLISAALMMTILLASNSHRFRAYTPLLLGTIIALCAVVEGPYSGMSMNPARTLSSAVWANQWRGLWVYWTAPFAGMLLAAQLYRMLKGLERVLCAKILHSPTEACLFHCRYGSSAKITRDRTSRAEF